MHPIASAILITWRRNGAYARRLVGDLTLAQWTAQPIPGVILNHPAWLLSHLNVYTPICTALLRGESFADPIDHRFGQRSEVGADASVYSSGPELLGTYESLHSEAEQALAAALAERFGVATPLERFRAMNPTVGDMLVMLMVKHESAHLGQLSAWRRAMGLARVAM